MNAMLNALRRMFRPAPRPAAPRGARLHLEALEERCVPSMTQITGAPTYPASAIVAVVSVFPDGQKIDGTGAMVDPDHVLTAGTMIYDPAYGGWATQIAVFAGTTSSTSYGPSAETKLARVEPAFYDTMNYRDGDIGEAGAGIGDFGLLTLNTNIGYLTGSFDLGSTDGSLAAGTSLNTIGYPEPLTDGWEMFQQYGPIASVSGGHYEQYAPQYGAPFVGPGGVFEFAYLDFSQNNIQEEPAQTGSPLFTYNNGQPSYIYGVMSDANSTTGYAEQITGYVSNDLHSWMDADNLGTTGVSPSDSVTYAPGVLPTQTTLQASASGPVSYGQSVTFTAYVSAPDAPTPITGLVTFKDNGSVLGTVRAEGHVLHAGLRLLLHLDAGRGQPHDHSRLQRDRRRLPGQHLRAGHRDRGARAERHDPDRLGGRGELRPAVDFHGRGLRSRFGRPNRDGDVLRQRQSAWHGHTHSDFRRHVLRQAHHLGDRRGRPHHHRRL